MLLNAFLYYPISTIHENIFEVSTVVDQKVVPGADLELSPPIKGL